MTALRDFRDLEGGGNGERKGKENTTAPQGKGRGHPVFLFWTKHFSIMIRVSTRRAEQTPAQGEGHGHRQGVQQGSDLHLPSRWPQVPEREPRQR